MRIRRHSPAESIQKTELIRTIYITTQSLSLSYLHTRSERNTPWNQLLWNMSIPYLAIRR